MGVSMTLQVSMFVALTKAEGPGKRFSLWLQGCDLGCPDCCNPEMWRPDGGTAMSVESILSEVKKTNGIEGISILGGEPFQQKTEDLESLCKEIQSLGLSVMIYTGYDLEELQKLGKDVVLKHVDLLVAGRYIKEQRTTKRRWIGSENQKLHFLSDRYSPEDPRFSEPNQAEIKLSNTGELTVVGFPFDSIRKAFPKKINV